MKEYPKGSIVYDVVIVGAGIFGSMIHHYLTDKGLDCHVVDSRHPMAASKCSAGVWKDGWVSKELKPFVKESLEVLEDFVRVKSVDFDNLDNNKNELFKRINCSDFLLTDKSPSLTIANVVKVDDDAAWVDLGIDVVAFYARKAVVVAAGFFTYELLGQSGYENMPKLDAQWGEIIVYNRQDRKPFTQIWAPYKQIVTFPFIDTGNVKRTYFGDGSTVKNPKKDDPRMDNVEKRLFNHSLKYNFKPGDIVDLRQGFRPYIKDKSKSTQFVNKHSKKVFSATGGRKNSTILSGYVAKEIHRQIMNK